MHQASHPLPGVPLLQIAARELRLVQVHRVAVPAVGQPATFQLLRRPRDGITPEIAGGDATAAALAGGGSTGISGAGEAAGGPAASSSGKAGEGSKRVWTAAGGGSSGGGGTSSSSGGPAAAAGGKAGKGGPGKGAATACNRFSKFTLVSESNATAMWVAEAERLAQYAAQVSSPVPLGPGLTALSLARACGAPAAQVPVCPCIMSRTAGAGSPLAPNRRALSPSLPQVTSEGGIEAAYEAPNVYSAIDALATRARAAAERRQRLLLEAADPMAQVRVGPIWLGVLCVLCVSGVCLRTVYCRSVPLSLTRHVVSLTRRSIGLFHSPGSPLTCSSTCHRMRC